MTEFDSIYLQFQREKDKIPIDISRKLQLLHHCLVNPQKVSNLSEQDEETMKDFADMDEKGRKMLFTSIVKSILSPKMYSSFEKNCKIKIDNTRWTNAYISFEDRTSITFNTFKKKFKFNIINLEINFLTKPQKNTQSSQKNQSFSNIKFLQSLRFNNKNPSVKMEFNYRGIRKLKIKFEHQQAADTLVENIHEMKRQLIGMPIQVNYNINLNKQFTEKLMNEYKSTYSGKDITIRLHKKQAKIYIQLFMTKHFWEIQNLFQFLICHKLWNCKTKQQKISLQNGQYFIERRIQGSSLLLYDRRTLCKLKFHRISDVKYCMEQCSIPSQSTSKSTIIADMSTITQIQLLSQKVAKITIQSFLNAKGYCRESDNRKFLSQYFNDISQINSKYQKLKKKGKINPTLKLNQILICEQTKANEKKQQDLQNDEKLIRQKKYLKKQPQQQFFSISDIQNDRFENNVFDQFHDDIGDREVKNVLGDNDDDDNQSNSSSNSIEKEVQTNISSFKKKKQDKIIEGNCSQVVSVEHANQIMKNCEPLYFLDKIKLQFIKAIKEKTFEKSYLKQTFSYQCRSEYKKEVPWYDPSVLLYSGKDYEPSEENELIFINQELIQGQLDSLKFVVKQIGVNLISGRSLLNVSLPVDIFEGRSLLERNAASFSAAPKYLKPVAEADVLTQLKAVTGLMTSISPMELIMQKPFNPILGETFQGYISGIPIFYEQISHHPPISAYYMKCDQFLIYGNLIAFGSASFNSGCGGNAGLTNVKMKNGNHFQFRCPPAQISGLIFGKRKYRIFNKGFVINKQHRLYAEVSPGKQSKGLYQRSKDEKPTKGDLLGGIFKVNEKFFNTFEKQKNVINYLGMKKSDMQEKIADIRGIWYRQIEINGVQINKNMEGCVLEYFRGCLPSDSNFRLDVIMHRINDLALSQKEKEILEDIQRRDRKLREKYQRNK